MFNQATWGIMQRAKKVVSDSPWLVDFAIGLVNSFFEEFKLQKNCKINLLVKTFLGLVEMVFGLVNVSFSLPEWQAVKMTFFAPCYGYSHYWLSVLFHLFPSNCILCIYGLIYFHVFVVPSTEFEDHNRKLSLYMLPRMTKTGIKCG